MYRTLEYLSGISDSDVSRLRAVGIRHTNQLLHRASLEIDRKRLSRKTGVSVERLFEFVNQCTLLCLEHLKDNSSVLLVWSGGFPNRGVKRLLEQAAQQKVRIRVWCDLDLGGVRIARVIHQITSGMAEPVKPIAVIE